MHFIYIYVYKCLCCSMVGPRCLCWVSRPRKPAHLRLNRYSIHCTCVYVCVHVDSLHGCTLTHAHIYIYIHTYIHTYTHIHIHTYTYANTNINAMAPFGSLNTAKFQLPDLLLLRRDQLLQPWANEWTIANIYIYIGAKPMGIKVFIETKNAVIWLVMFLPHPWMQFHMFAMQDLHRQLQFDFGSPCEVIIYLHDSCKIYICSAIWTVYQI